MYTTTLELVFFIEVIVSFNDLIIDYKGAYNRIFNCNYQLNHYKIIMGCLNDLNFVILPLWMVDQKINKKILRGSLYILPGIFSSKNLNMETATKVTLKQ